jgi:hypothetical protein
MSSALTSTSTFDYDLRVSDTGHLTGQTLAELVDRLTDFGYPLVGQDRTVTAVIPMDLSDDPFTAGVQFAQRLDELEIELSTFGMRRGLEWTFTPRTPNTPWPVGDDVI